MFAVKTDRVLSPLITRQELRKCINSFKRGSGSGHDGLTPDHLKDLINENLGIVSDDLLDSMCFLLNETVLPGRFRLPTKTKCSETVGHSNQ